MPASAKDVPNPVSPTAQNLAAAGAIYADRCARCHGERGAGDGSDASLYKPLPASLTDEQTRQTTDGELFWKIGKGRRPMPGYGSELTAEQRWQLVNLLRTFAASPDCRPCCRGGCSRGKVTCTVVPLTAAKQRTAAERHAISRALAAVLVSIG